jgi:hypothetical protein
LVFVELQFTKLNEVFEIAQNLLSGGDLLWELSFMDHFFSLEQRKYENFALNKKRLTKSADVVCILIG